MNESLTTEALTTELPTTEAALDRARHEFAQSHGLDVMPDPLPLDKEQQRQIADEFFADPKEALAKGLRDFDATGVSRNAVVEATKVDLVGPFSRLRSGDKVPVLLVPPSAEYFKQSAIREDIKPAVALIRRAQGLQAAELLLGIGEGSLASTYLPKYETTVYNSPQNGAPIITERVTEVPGATIHEMNLHGAGSSEVVDTQVVIAPK